MSSPSERPQGRPRRIEGVSGGVAQRARSLFSQELNQLLAASPGTRPGRGVSLAELELRASATYYATKHRLVRLSSATTSRRRPWSRGREVPWPRASGAGVRLVLLGRLEKRQRLEQLKRQDGRPWTVSRLEGHA